MTLVAPSLALSEATGRANAFVAERRADAEALGRELGELVGDPEAFADALSQGFARLADPVYRDAHAAFIAPGIGPTFGLRWPLHAAVSRGFRAATRGVQPSTLLFAAELLFHVKQEEARWFAFGILGRVLPADPERAWQLLRRGAREATNWITVDTLAHQYVQGILAEPYRWAELEQLIYSPSRWERRLVGSTIATMPFEDRRRGREPEIARHGLNLIGDLIGDADPDVQKALSWALRSLVRVDASAVARFCDEQAAIAAAEDDGQRAWVLRDALAKLEPGLAQGLRERLSGIRRRRTAPPTSRATATAGRFGPLPDPRAHPEPPLVP